MTARPTRALPQDVRQIIDETALRHEVTVAEIFEPYRKMSPRVRQARDEAVAAVSALREPSAKWRYRTGEIGRFFGITRVAVDQCRLRSGQFVSRR